MPETTAPDTFTQEWVEEFAGHWLDAWNSHEPDRLLALMAEDIVYDDSAWPQTMRGHGEVREFLEFTWRAFPDMTFEAAGNALLDGEESRAAFWWKGRATNSGPIEPPGMPATNKRVEFEGADFHEYEDGRVKRLRIVFDMADFARQLGLLPDRGSMSEKALVMTQRLRAKLP
jgi:steroid delta-isomerase-like uncharacterized protein